MTQCAIEYLTRQYLTQQEENDARQERLETSYLKEVRRGGEYDPMNDVNFAEALAEKVNECDETFDAAIFKLMETGNGEGLIIAFKNMTQEYWTKYAERQAQKAFAEGE